MFLIQSRWPAKSRWRNVTARPHDERHPFDPLLKNALCFDREESAERAAADMRRANAGEFRIVRHWTASDVRAELPSVEVMIAGKRHTGRVTGRANQFATVTVTGWKRHDPPWMDWEFSWQTIANALNSDTPLRV